MNARRERIAAAIFEPRVVRLQQQAAPAPPPTQSPPAVKPRFQLFSEWLQEPDVPMRWLIDGWMNEGSRILTFVDADRRY